MLPALTLASSWSMSSSSSRQQLQLQQLLLVCCSVQRSVAACRREMPRSMRGSRARQQTPQSGPLRPAYQRGSNGGRSCACSSTTMFSHIHPVLLLQAEEQAAGRMR